MVKLFSIKKVPLFYNLFLGETIFFLESDRYKKSTRVFSKNNECATCHLDPDHLLHNLQSKYPSFSDIKAFMRVGHARYWTNLTPVPDDELIEVYRTLK